VDFFTLLEKIFIPSSLLHPSPFYSSFATDRADIRQPDQRRSQAWVQGAGAHSVVLPLRPGRQGLCGAAPAACALWSVGEQAETGLNKIKPERSLCSCRALQHCFAHQMQ